MKTFSILLLLTVANMLAQVPSSSDYSLAGARFVSSFAESSSTDFSLTALTLDMSGELKSNDYAILDGVFNNPAGEKSPQIIASTALVTENNFRFTIVAFAGQKITVEASDDLQVWRAIAADVIATDSWSFVVTISTNGSQFFRALVNAP